MFLKFLDAKPCRTIVKLPQQVIPRPETCKTLWKVEQNPAPPLVLVFWECLEDNKDISANPRARNPFKSIIQIHWKSTEIHREAHTTSSHMPPPPHPPPPSMWEEGVGASLWISKDFQWIWVDFLHVDSHLYLYYLQGISRRQVLMVVQDSAHTPYNHRNSKIGMPIFNIYKS